VVYSKLPKSITVGLCFMCIDIQLPESMQDNDSF
jgi:hypothetical protein